MATDLLHYRAWRGRFHHPAFAAWPIARVALTMMFRRKLFWGLYALSSLYFLLFFFGHYLLAWASSQLTEASVRVGGMKVEPQQLIHLFQGLLHLDGTPQEYALFFGFQGHMVMIILALAGSLLIGNDIHFGSLPFYLAKPLTRLQYVLGKGMAVALFINLLTTVPVTVLFLQFGFLSASESFWSHYSEHYPILLGILGYGATLTVSLTLLLLATASWLRRTVPLIMAWTTLFLFCRLLANGLVDLLGYDPAWRLIDVWNDTALVGSACLGITPSARQPAVGLAAGVLAATCVACLGYLIVRIRAVEVVR